MRAVQTAVMLSLVAAAAAAQQTLVETIEVRVASVDVVVRDRAGNPVAGMTKDDFELYDDGVRQTLTNFYEVRRTDAGSEARDSDVPLEVRQRRVVVFIDSASLTPSRKKAMIESVQRFIDGGMRSEDQCMLVSWRMATEVVTAFTNDKAALRRGLETIAHVGPAGEMSPEGLAMVRRNIDAWVDNAENNVIPWSQAYTNSRAIVDRYGEQLINRERELLGAVDAISATMAGLRGKKVFVFVGEHLPQNPAAEMYRYVNDQFHMHVSRNEILNMDTVLGAIGNDMAYQISELAREASARGVTMYAIGADPINSNLAADSSTHVDYGYSFSRDANTASALQTIASITGGVAITRSSNFDLAFDTITRDLASYYSLGYKPAGEGGHEHKITVKAKNPQLSVRARQTFVVQSTDDQMADRAIANLYVDTTPNDWPISIRSGLPKRDGKKFIVPIQVVIPATMTFIPQQDSLAGSFILYFAVGDPRGKTSTVLRRPEDLKIPSSLEKTVRAKPMIFRTALRVNSGESMLSVAILDQLSGTVGFARMKIAAR